MNVLVITYDIKPTSGWGRYSYEVINGLQKKGIKVLFIAEKRHLNFHNILLCPSTTFFNFIHNIFIVRRAAQSCEIVHALDGWPYGIYGFFAVLGTKKKLFITGIGTYSVAPLYSSIKGILLYISYRKAKKIFCISLYTKEQIALKTKLQNLTVVHLGSTQLPKPKKEEIRSTLEKYKLNSANPILLTVGQIKDRKGQYETLQTIKLLSKRFPSICYLIVGSDKDTSYVNKIRLFIQENDLQKNVQIISNVFSDIELSCIYTLSTIVLLNSNTENHHFEGFGLVLLEANQFGKPVIGSRDSGIEDAIQDGYNGLLSEQRSPKNIAEKVIQILNSYEIFSSRAKIFEEKFSWNQTVEEYITAYQLK